MEKKKRKLSVPHTYVIIGIILVIVTLMTYVIPAGQYDRVMDEASGQEIIVTGSYHHVEQTPVGPFKMVTALAEGMVDASDIIFFCFFAYGLVYMMIKTGAFYGGVSALKRVMRGKEILILPVSASLSPWAMTAWWAERQSYWASSLGLRQRHSIRLPSVLHKASPDYPSDQGSGTALSAWCCSKRWQSGTSCVTPTGSKKIRAGLSSEMFTSTWTRG